MCICVYLNNFMSVEMCVNRIWAYFSVSMILRSKNRKRQDCKDLLGWNAESYHMCTDGLRKQLTKHTKCTICKTLKSLDRFLIKFGLWVSFRTFSTIFEQILVLGRLLKALSTIFWPNFLTLDVLYTLLRPNFDQNRSLIVL